MGFSCGFVGMPNVGKSTLFNALLSEISAEAANYPFCTIEPNFGRVAVPDERLSILADLAKTNIIIPTSLEFVDIAGLVKGASKGEGLGNKFLSHIRDVDAIAYVLRCFEDDNITHVEGKVDPLRDFEIIETELILADLENLEKRITGLTKKAKNGDKISKEILSIAEKILDIVADGRPARTFKFDDDREQKIFKNLQLLTAKPAMVICNVDEDSAASGNILSDKIQKYCSAQNIPSVIVSAKIEEELSGLNIDEKQEFLNDLSLKESGLSQIIRTGYELLNLITFFTVGVKEARAWTVFNGATAPNSAGVIHSDFEKGFIRAETISYMDYVICKSEQNAKDAGKMRLEGKDYIAQDGDIFHFRFNV